MVSNRSGHLVREQRERFGLSRSALARKIGISTNYLAKIEHGMDRPSSAIVIRMLLALELAEDRSERVERLRGLAVPLDAALRDRIVLRAAEAGGDFEDIQAALFAAQQEWMAQFGTPESAATRRGYTRQNTLRHVAG